MAAAHVPKRQIRSVITPASRLEAGRVPTSRECAEDRDGSLEPGGRTSGDTALPRASCTRGD